MLWYICVQLFRFSHVSAIFILFNPCHVQVSFKVELILFNMYCHKIESNVEAAKLLNEIGAANIADSINDNALQALLNDYFTTGTINLRERAYTELF